MEQSFSAMVSQWQRQRGTHFLFSKGREAPILWELGTRSAAMASPFLSHRTTIATLSSMEGRGSVDSLLVTSVIEAS